MKLFVRFIAGLLGFALIIAGGGYVFFRASLPAVSGRIAVAGLGGAVEIVRDRRGVPNIFARSSDDAFFALGFVHAQDRLFQMEMMRLSGQGRLAEVAGRPFLDFDRFIRLLDFNGQVEASFAALSPGSRARLAAYAAGVNAFLAQRSGPLPPEFWIVDHRPAPWRPQDSLYWSKLMALQLTGNWRDELARAQIATRMSPVLAAQLWPEWPADVATRGLIELYRDLDLDRLAAALPLPLGPSQASNEWVLSGERTRSGKPLLANAPHLGLAAPGQWYLVRLEAPGLTLAGATAPGVPAVVLGHNRRIAWGLTTTNGDTSDLFIERLDPTDPNFYLTPDGSAAFTTRTETIKVRGEPDETFVARQSRHGVVLSDVNRAAGTIAAKDHVLALAWPGLSGADRTPDALFAINRANSWGEFVAALSDWQAPMQNIVYADIDGNIGSYSPALVPQRKSGDGWLPQPGWTGASDWVGFVPFADLPHAFNPAAGWIANANNRIAPANPAVFIGRDFDAPYRAERIAELIADTPKHDIASTMAIDRDSVSRFAREILSAAPAVAPRDDLSRRALDLLRRWDGSILRGRPEPLIFNAWMREMIVALIRHALGPDGDDLVRDRPQMIRAAFYDNSPFCDDPARQARETCADLAATALARAMATLAGQLGSDIERWQWGSVHYAAFRHPLLSRIPIVRDIVGFRIPTDGDYYTVNRGATRLSDKAQPFLHVHGAGYQAIYDLSNLDASQFMVVPGQSGNPLSRHWGDLAAEWAAGRFFAISGDKAELAKTADVLVLTPQ
ncbi:MAG: penicillin acylase family protein [Rhodospirillales bacterium]|nr:penicillin acylase family protein [Rhodospirillales bacterium]